MLFLAVTALVINHRRVRTVMRWFERHFTRLPSGTPFRPGDVVFFDTFPTKSLLR
jgi:uncharacterized protein YijF (DUF1287 family)